MGMRATRLVAALLCLAALPGGESAACKLATVGELPVTMKDLRALVPARINGKEVLFIADSGAFYSMIWPSAVREFDLKLRRPAYEMTSWAVGGAVELMVTTVDEFTIGGFAVPKVDFIVGIKDLDPGVVGLLGQNVLGLADVEYDFAHGMIRLMSPDDGCRKAALAYWAGTGPFSAIDIDRPSTADRGTKGVAYVNGTPVDVLFDTGAPLSILTLEAAARAGVKPGDVGVVPAGQTGGLGRGRLDTWIAPFSSFKIGDEQITHTRLRIGDLGLAHTDMLIGWDFFYSHRVYVANRQSKMYFTYNGGPVFDLRVTRPALEVEDKPPLAPKPPADGSD